MSQSFAQVIISLFVLMDICMRLSHFPLIRVSLFSLYKLAVVTFKALEHGWMSFFLTKSQNH